MNGIWGLGIDLRRTISGSKIFIGVDAEYLWMSQTFTVEDNSGVTVPVKDGYVAFPIELTGYFTIPVGGESFHVYIGGGVGMYFGQRVYSYDGIYSHISDRTPGTGIHVASGVEYNFTSTFALRMETKFREVQFQSSNEFPQLPPYVQISPPYAGQAFDSRISIDGIYLNLGIVMRF